MYIADAGNNRIRKVTASTGIITTVTGTGTGSYSGDNGQATSATIKEPMSVSVDSSGLSHYSLFRAYYNILTPYLGNLYIADYGNNRIRKVTASTGIITTIAGNGGTGSYSGDGGAATSAALNTPFGVAVDTSGNNILSSGSSCNLLQLVSLCNLLGNVYIADSSNNRVRKVYTVSTEIPTTAPSCTPR